MAGNYRHSGLRVAVVSASSGGVANGALCYQEGFVGIALTAAAVGASFTMQKRGTFVVPVPVSTVKGDRLYATIVPGTDQVALTLDRTTGAGKYYIGTAEGDRDADGKALVNLDPYLGAAFA